MRVWVLITALCLPSCALFAPSHHAQLTPVTYSALSGWDADDHAAAFVMFQQNCGIALARKQPYRHAGKLSAWRAACANAQKLQRLKAPAAKLFFERHFTPHRVRTEASAQGLITGYYEPVLRGSYVHTHRYNVPVYGVPKNLKTPDITRAEIDAGRLGNRSPILLYVDDPVMLFFMHVQGSGKVQLPSGRTVSLQFAAKNGHEYYAIGKTLRDKYGLKKINLQTIREWLYAHPEHMRDVLHTNPSYIFFDIAAGDAYPKGALGVPLTPMRSLAIDDDHASYGVLSYVDVPLTAAEGNEPPRLQRLMISQDTGSALLGAHRGDVFFGRGESAERLAGAQNARGNIYWLLPNAAHE